MNNITFKPSFLVLDGLSLKGGIKYRIYNQKTETVGNQEIKTWNGKRIIDDVQEFNKAKAFRERMWRLLQKDPGSGKEICVNTVIGLICPLEKRSMLDHATKEIDDKIANFNPDLRTCKVFFSPVMFVIAQDNWAAVTTVARNIIEILENLKSVLIERDFKSIRNYLHNTRGLPTIWPDDIGDKLQKAFDSCRKHANDIAKKIREAPDKIEKTRMEVDTSLVELALAAFQEIIGE